MKQSITGGLVSKGCMNIYRDVYRVRVGLRLLIRFRDTKVEVSSPDFVHTQIASVDIDICLCCALESARVSYIARGGFLPKQSMNPSSQNQNVCFLCSITFHKSNIVVDRSILGPFQIMQSSRTQAKSTGNIDQPCSTQSSITMQMNVDSTRLRHHMHQA